MKASRYDQPELTDGLYATAAIWAVLLGSFAVAGAMSHDEPRQVAQEAPFVANDPARAAAVVVNAPGVSQAEARDAALAVHEELDAVIADSDGNPTR